MSPNSVDPMAGLPRNFLRPCLLLIIGESPSYGYNLVERLRKVGIRRIDPGLLYRSLRAMEQDGLVQSSWANSEVGPPRRTYRLSQEGLDWLHTCADSLRETQRTIQLFLQRYEMFATHACPVVEASAIEASAIEAPATETDAGERGEYGDREP